MSDMNDFSASSSVRRDEIERFSALATQWWDPQGPMAPLHAMNPARVKWVAQKAQDYFRRSGLSLIDVGCGAGIASEAFARAGFDTFAIDASSDNIDAAKRHLELCGLPPFAAPLKYRATTAEKIVCDGYKFDVVSSLEVIEHVQDPQKFMRLLSDLAKPKGLVAVSTLNRNTASWIQAKLGAEYLMRLLPVGTHEWKQFVTPNELANWGGQAGLRLRDIAGLKYGSPEWTITRKPDVNYITIFEKI